MELTSEFKPLTIDGVGALSKRMKQERYRFVQILAVNTEAGVDVVYSFMSPDGRLENNKIEAVGKSDVLPSITDDFLAAFVFENEIHDLFGVSIEGIAIDFGGKFYKLAQSEPMTIISPAQKAAREKAAKAEAAKRARAAKSAEAEYAAEHPEALEATRKKISGLDPSLMGEDTASRPSSDPEKVARTRAGYEERARAAAEEKAAKDAMRQEKVAKLDEMDPEKAAKVRAALERKKQQAEAQKATGSSNVEREAQIEAKIAQLDPERQAKVLAALDAQARKETAKRQAANKEGEN